MIGNLLISACLSVSGLQNQWSDSTFTNILVRSAGFLPNCLCRFKDYPPDPGKLGFPRCLFESPLVQNPYFYLKQFDFSCVSPWNDNYGQFRAGTAISKRHIIFAKHYPLKVGTRIAFVGVNGDTSNYRIKAVKPVEIWDIMIGLLDYELTPDIRPATVFPANINNWIKPGSYWPIITFNQKEQAVLSKGNFKWHKDSESCILRNEQITDKHSNEFSRNLTKGDSGNPAFLIYNRTPILIYCLSTGGIGDGSMIHNHYSAIQNTMNDLCPGYSLKVFDPLELK